MLLIPTDDGSIYQLDILTFDDALLSTCHTGAILDIAFPKGVDTVFGTCGEDGIRIWSDVDKMGGKEVLHVPGPPHAQANCLLFSQDGKSMISGWSDGCIRSHTPQSGKLLYSITVCIIHNLSFLEKSAYHFALLFGLMLDKDMILESSSLTFRVLGHLELF